MNPVLLMKHMLFMPFISYINWIAIYDRLSSPLARRHLGRSPQLALLRVPTAHRDLHEGVEGPGLAPGRQPRGRAAAHLQRHERQLLAEVQRHLPAAARAVHAAQRQPLGAAHRRGLGEAALQHGIELRGEARAQHLRPDLGA